MKRVLILGLPRTGTTWLARILTGGEEIRYVHEPDNIEQGLLPWVPFDGLGPFPALEPGDPAPDFRSLWRLAFAGGWPDRPAIHRLRRASRSTLLPRRARIRLALATARLAASFAPASPIVVAKSVRSYLAAEWIAREFQPDMVIVWRHPLNVVPSWGEREYDRAWLSAAPMAAKTVVRKRFEGTAAWPPPDETGPAGGAWAVCAPMVLLLEAAARHPEWALVHHEEQCLDPATGFRSLFGRLRLQPPHDLAARLAETDREGEGYEILRRAAEEPGRWRHRLSADEQKIVMETVDRFAATSEVAARAWTASPALDPALGAG